MLHPIETRPYLSDGDFRADYLDQKPIRLTAMTARWPALQWTFAGLKERVGTTNVVIKRYAPADSVDFFTETTRSGRPVVLGEWLRQLDEGVADAAWCLRESSAPFEHHPELVADFDFRGVFPRGRQRFRHYLWAGPAGYVTGLHTDEITINLLAHIAGRKRVVLYPNGAEVQFGPTTRSEIDGARYANVNPLELNVEGTVAELEPGDLLYIPQGYWHWAVAHTACLSLTGASETA
ncbi:MAG: cupin-like domain-containing protein [Myxococcota bacterium]